MTSVTSPICILCGVPITPDNDSAEHVIANALGGRRKINGVLCRKCNSAAGETWDVSLTKQMNPLCVLVEIERERGGPPQELIATTAGEELLVGVGQPMRPAKPVYTETETPAGAKIEIVARTMREARKMLTGVARKYPNLNVDEALAAARAVETFPEGVLHFKLEVGGHSALCSILKSVLVLAAAHGADRAQIRAASSYLDDESEEPPLAPFYSIDAIQARPRGVPLHAVAVRGDSKAGTLVGYAEFFGTYRYVVLLENLNLTSDFAGSYAVDPRDGTELRLTFDLIAAQQKAPNALNWDYSKLYAPMKAAFDEVMPEIMRRRHKTAQDHALGRAMDFAFKNCGAKEGEVLTSEHIKTLSRLIAEKMVPFLIQSQTPMSSPPSPPSGET